MSPATNLRPDPLPARALKALRGGFSLIEMVGVLAVITLLASALLPAFVKRIDLATRAAEVAKLSAMSNALVTAVLRTNAIINSDNWVGRASDWSMFSTNQVNFNSRRFQRRYYMRSGYVPVSTYAQDSYGTITPPSGLRAVIVSQLGGEPLPSTVDVNWAGGFLNTGSFDAFWNATEGDRPRLLSGAVLWPDWNVNGDDVLIQRIDFTPLFHRLVLVNRDKTGMAKYSINNSILAPIDVPNHYPVDNFPVDTYFLDGTEICLWENGTIATRYLIKRDISFVFEAGSWRAELMGEPVSGDLAREFARQADTFMALPRNPNGTSAANQQGIVTAMYSFMLTYTLWADQCPHFDWRTATSAEQVPEYAWLLMLGKSNARLDVFSQDLLTVKGP